MRVDVPVLYEARVEVVAAAAFERVETLFTLVRVETALVAVLRVLVPVPATAWRVLASVAATRVERAAAVLALPYVRLDAAENDRRVLAPETD